MVRPPVRGARLLSLLLLLTTLGVACGKKGPPLPPLRVAPARIEDLTVAKSGDEVRASFTIPSANDNQTQPADIATVELHAITGKPEDPFGQPLGGGEFVRLADLAGRLEVAPPPDPEAPPPPPNAPPVPADPRPAQGTVGVITEQLTADDLKPWVHPRKKSVPPPEVVKTASLARPLWAAPPEDPLSRTYVVLGISRRGVKGTPSNRVAVPILDPPGTPKIGGVAYDASAATVAWEPPPGARLAVQRPAAAGELEARSLAPGVTPTTYSLYRMRMEGATPGIDPTPVNASPTAGTAVTDPSITLGQERCYVVRALYVYGSARIEGAPSEPFCKRFDDIFPPAAPANLSAVGSEGGVSLIWDPNAEADLAGYLVLRGEIGPDGTAATLAPLTAEPVKETTYRDTTARRGVRYIYAIVAVDGSTPRNQSPESNRVEEGAR